MNYDKEIKEIIKCIDNDNFDPENTLPKINRARLKKLIRICEQEEYISHKSTKNQKLLLVYYEGFDLHPTTFVTKKGFDFLEGKSEQPTQQFNIHNSSGFNIGDYGLVNNYNSDIPLEDLKSYLNENVVLDDKAEYDELIDTLESGNLKPGVLNKFESFITKYPKTFDFVASFAGTALISGLNI